MIEGIIKSNNISARKGRIDGDDGKRYTFSYDDFTLSNFPPTIMGLRVSFHADDGYARNITIISPSTATGSETTRSAINQPETISRAATQNNAHSTRFLNPYNFVRTLEVFNPDAEPLLGRCVPPPHDRYTGMSGRIVCHITTTTPLFVSDSHSTSCEQIGNDKEHIHYRFFRDPEGNIAIPGSSLRGVIRSVFEAVTNSCFANFDENKRLSYHLPPGDALKLVPARVQHHGNQWTLEILPGTTPFAPEQKPSGPQYAAWVHTYTPLWASQTTAKVPRSPYACRGKLSLNGWEHGDPCQALIELVQHPLRRFEFCNVLALAKPDETLPRPVDNQQIVNGYLCITNQNIENKHDERLFFRAPGNKTALTPLSLSEEVVDRYKELIEDYQDRHTRTVSKRTNPTQPAGKDPAFSRFIVNKSATRLQDGDLVYAMIERKGHTLEVKFIVPVSVPRLGYDKTIGELLHPDDLCKCDHYEHLCPACRTFGWVWGTGEKQNSQDKDSRVAYSGRVTISHAHRIQSQQGSFDTTLAILSTPKPTTSRFYLAPKQGKPQDGVPDTACDYNNSGQKLRGRKFYRHHGHQLNAREYQGVDDKKSDQNRTVHDVQNSGTVFEFTVHFENLAEVELGALLWSLELENWHHRIGLGKPLGFGSAHIDIMQLGTLNTYERYSTLTSTGWINTLPDKQRLKKVFMQAMQDRYGKDFYLLDNVCDLRSLLAETPSLPIHYPRSNYEPHSDGRNYEWFVGNKRSGRNAGPRISLPLADEDNQGIPYIDRFGEELNQ